MVSTFESILLVLGALYFVVRLGSTLLHAARAVNTKRETVH